MGITTAKTKPTGAEEAKDPRHSQDLELQIKRTTGSHQAHGT
jgi:hypothetical protein